MGRINTYSNKTAEASDKVLGTDEFGNTNNFLLSSIKKYNAEDDGAPIERAKGFSTGLENGHRWVTGGDELYAMDELEGTAWAVGGFSATLPQNVVVNQKRGGIIHPLKRHMLDFEEYSVLVDNANSTSAVSGSTTSAMTETSRTNRACFGVKFITEEALVADKLVHEIWYGANTNGACLFRYDYKHEEITASAGDTVTLWFSSPYEIDESVEIYHRTLKADGSTLQVRPTTEDAGTPYVVHLMRQFEDRAQLFLPVYDENTVHFEDDRIWRYDSILVARSNLKTSTNHPRPFHIDEWSEVGTDARYQITNSPCVNFDQATSKATIGQELALHGDFKIAFHYSGGGGATPVYNAGSDDLSYLKRDNTAGEWIMAITGVEYSISDAVDPVVGDEICFTRAGAVFELFVNDSLRGSTATSTAPYNIKTIGNLTTPTASTASGKIHDIMLVNLYGQIHGWFPMQENSGTTGYNVISDETLTYTDVSWGTQDLTNHARNYGVRIEGAVYVPGKPAGIVGAEAANGGQMTHYPSFGDNGCGIGDIIGFNGEIGRYKETGTLAVVSGTPFILPIDGTEDTEEYPVGLGQWDVVNNKTAFATNHQNVRIYRVRLTYTLNASTAGTFMNVKLRLAGGTQATILEWDDSIGKQNVDVVHTGERTIYTTADILTNQLEIYMEANTNGTITSQEILIVEG